MIPKTIKTTKNNILIGVKNEANIAKDDVENIPNQKYKNGFRAGCNLMIDENNAPLPSNKILVITIVKNKNTISYDFFLSGNTSIFLNAKLPINPNKVAQNLAANNPTDINVKPITTP